ncbi:hypothetical protein [Streptomyces sp. IB201691-2A2]|uniref:hypothetical protein n=1 Tax=Streptomyces sp. IB201691-2A2 TaxID=2561920 RepID=UPI00117ECA40|nr:hypothetical protein [Streptomyces sp. IB201691-2A2]TRO55315.1 hypothetical protein E4K73_50865 [Streptomyces sp. IB201691-2A2]
MSTPADPNISYPPSNGGNGGSARRGIRRGYTVQTGLDSQSPPPQPFSRKWIDDHTQGAVNAFASRQNILTTAATSLSAATVALNNLSTDNRIAATVTAALGILAAGTGGIAQAREGNVAPQLGNFLTSVSSLLSTISEFLPDDNSQKDKLATSAKVLLATGVFITTYNAGAHHSLEVAGIRQGEDLANNLAFPNSYPYRSAEAAHAHPEDRFFQSPEPMSRTSTLPNRQNRTNSGNPPNRTIGRG